ncbi:restriction endonuclease subunit S [Helicobacter ailurogastricus]|uniref:restriction endonuclease subunit S n=2 Tax=Helicobacter ailurogastricus TaxID=1578720 RepID=UPI0022C3A741|nr:restriction endonuclease subunit S [Helicobacter ailurogastricus]GLH58496.1 hypothetical protein NHP214376_12870 [Helicobacter ailurogastricus]
MARLAQWLLLETLLLDQKTHSIKTLKQSLGSSGRLDAEYYQEKYERAEAQLKKHGFVLLEDICSHINYGSVPTSPYCGRDEGIPYIKGLNLKNLSISGRLDCIKDTQKLASKFFTQKNDIIISQMGTVGDVGVVSQEQEGYIFASFTIRVRLKDPHFNPFYIALYIQDIAKNWYLQRHIAQASVRQNTDLPTIRKLYIPKIPTPIQENIAKHLQNSFTLRAQAKEALERAKMQLEHALNLGGGGGKPCFYPPQKIKNTRPYKNLFLLPPPLYLSPFGFKLYPFLPLLWGGGGG